jgi:hypothetical protein
LAVAVDQVEAWLEATSLLVLAEGEGYWGELRTALQAGRVTGMTHGSRRCAGYMAFKSCGPWTGTLAGFRD